MNIDKFLAVVMSKGCQTLIDYDDRMKDVYLLCRIKFPEVRNERESAICQILILVVCVEAAGLDHIKGFSLVSLNLACDVFYYTSRATKSVGDNWRLLTTLLDSIYFHHPLFVSLELLA